MSFPFGQPVTLTFRTFSDAAQTVPADPTTVAVDILDPAGAETTHTWAGGQVVHVSTGVFTYTVTPTLAGHYAAHWYSGGAVATTQDESFNVDAKYGQTLVPVDEFATYLSQDTADLNLPRAAFILAQAQTLCESIVKPLPAGAEAVILDVAERAYANPISQGGDFLAYSEGVGPYSTQNPGLSGGGLYLTQENKATLRRLNGGGGAFTIDTTPAGAGTSLPWWDTGVTYSGAVGGDWDVPA
ncbi:MAG: hypothetical protein JO222_00850 [Frankiales bacterium]|nr:hypothetical protein [Frankiales bacterium]